MKKTPFLLGLAACATLLAPGLAQAAPEMEMNMAGSYIGPHVLILQGQQPWVEEIETKSNGRLKIHFFASGSLVKQDDVVPSIINGNVDLGAAGLTYQENFFPHSLAITMPHLTKNSKHSTEFYWQAYERLPEVKAELDKVGKLITIWGSDRSGLFSTKGPIMKPEDMKGKRVLIWNGGQADQVKAWGGVPVQVLPNDTYMGLQRGMGEVFFGPVPAGVSNKLMEVAKDVTVFPATAIPVILWMNWELWNEMPADLQKLVDDTTGHTMGTRFGQLLFDATNRDIITMQNAGMKIHDLTDAQYKVFSDADNAVVAEYWMKNLKRLGVQDPGAWMKKIRDISVELAPQF